jgi:hypothetical protein
VDKGRERSLRLGLNLRTAFAVAALLTPVAVAIVGSVYSNAIKEREIQGKFVELAVGILREAPTDQTKHLREWAIKILDKHSGVPVGPHATEDLLENIPIPGPRRNNPTCIALLRQADQLMRVGEHVGAVSYLKEADQHCGK